MKKISDFTFVMAYVLSVSFAALVISTASPRVVVTECPDGDTYEYDEIVEFYLQAGSADIISLFVYIEKNGEQYSRFNLSQEYNPATAFEFPVSFEKQEFSWSIDRSFGDYGDTFSIFVEIIDENYKSGSDYCELKFA